MRQNKQTIAQKGHFHTIVQRDFLSLKWIIFSPYLAPRGGGEGKTQGSKNALNFLSPNIAILSLSNVFSQ